MGTSGRCIAAASSQNAVDLIFKGGTAVCVSIYASTYTRGRRNEAENLPRRRQKRSEAKFTVRGLNRAVQPVGTMHRSIAWSQQPDAEPQKITQRNSLITKLDEASEAIKLAFLLDGLIFTAVRSIVR